MFRSIETSITVMVGFIRTIDWHSEIFSLVVRQFRELDTEVREVKAGHFLVEFLGEYVDLFLVLAFVLPQGDLGQNLVGE